MVSKHDMECARWRQHTVPLCRDTNLNPVAPLSGLLEEAPAGLQILTDPDSLGTDKIGYIPHSIYHFKQ